MPALSSHCGHRLFAIHNLESECFPPGTCVQLVPLVARQAIAVLNFPRRKTAVLHLLPQTVCVVFPMVSCQQRTAHAEGHCRTVLSVRSALRTASIRRSTTHVARLQVRTSRRPCSTHTCTPFAANLCPRFEKIRYSFWFSKEKGPAQSRTSPSSHSV